MTPSPSRLPPFSLMRYLWTGSIRMRNARLMEVLGTEPHTPLNIAVRETLIGIGCVPVDSQGAVMGSSSLAAGSW